MNEFQQIKRGRVDTITLIEDSTIDRIAKIQLFDEKFMNMKLYDLHQELLRVSKKKNKSFEVGFFWDLTNINNVVQVKGTLDCISLNSNVELRNKIKTAPMNSIVVLHNHPKNGLFSGADLKSFAAYNSIYAMTAVCNDGTIYMMKKTEEFDPFELMMYYNIGISEGKEYSGIKNVAKNAHKIGIVYRCSVKRRKKYDK